MGLSSTCRYASRRARVRVWSVLTRVRGCAPARTARPFRRWPRHTRPISPRALVLTTRASMLLRDRPRTRTSRSRFSASPRTATWGSASQIAQPVHGFPAGRALGFPPGIAGPEPSMPIRAICLGALTAALGGVVLLAGCSARADSHAGVAGPARARAAQRIVLEPATHHPVAAEAPAARPLTSRPGASQGTGRRPLPAVPEERRVPH